MFMTFIVCAYIFWVSPENLAGAPVGFGLPYKVAIMFALQDAVILGFLLCARGKHLAIKTMPSNRISGIPPENSKRQISPKNKRIKAKSVILMALFFVFLVIHPLYSHFIKE